MAHFAALNESRRRATLNDVVLTQTLHSMSSNAANLGTGLLLLLAASSMRSGRSPWATSPCSSPTWAG